MNNIDIAKQYFAVSNISDFNKIAELFSETSTYSSQNTGLYLWVRNIIEMQKWFHGSFEKLNWKVLEFVEEKPWIIRTDFEFSWVKDGEKIAAYEA